MDSNPSPTKKDENARLVRAFSIYLMLNHLFLGMRQWTGVHHDKTLMFESGYRVKLAFSPLLHIEDDGGIENRVPIRTATLRST